MPWLWDEDMAMKAKVSDFAVFSDRRGQHEVPVPAFFRFPDPEEVAHRPYPHITVDLIDVQFDPTRAHRAYELPINYIPPNTPPPGVNQTYVYPDMPLPWALIYQVSAFSRNPLHDRQLQYNLFGTFPEQWGSLDMSNIDGTVRRADLVGTANNDRLDEEEKRLFHKIFTVSVSSEMPLYAALLMYKVTQNPSITLDEYDGIYTQFPPNLVVAPS